MDTSPDDLYAQMAADLFYRPLEAIVFDVPSYQLSDIAELYWNMRHRNKAVFEAVINQGEKNKKCRNIFTQESKEGRDIVTFVIYYSILRQIGKPKKYITNSMAIYGLMVILKMVKKHKINLHLNSQIKPIEQNSILQGLTNFRETFRVFRTGSSTPASKITFWGHRRAVGQI